MAREMKNSGIEWLGDIPAEWNIVKIGSQYTERKTKVSDKDYPPLSVTMKGIVPQLANAAKSDAHDDRKLVCIGDFAINSRSDRRGSCGISEYDGSVSLINTILAPRDEMNPKYYNWLFHSTMFSDEFYKWGHGIVNDLWTTNWQDMKRIAIPEPPLSEQKRIADFLDCKCAEIDTVIEKTKETIEEYKKLKQSVITEAVTKGIRGDRAMKDSGIECVGDIPTTFNKYRIKHIAELYGRIGFRGYTTDDLVDEGEGAITLSPSNLRDMTMSYSKLSYLTWQKYEESPEIKINNGDILMVKTGSSYGKTALVDNLPLEATINPQLIVIKNIKISTKYLLYCFQTPYFLDQVENAVVGGTIPTMAQEKIYNFYVFVPDELEQEEIVESLDKKCAEIDKLIADKTHLLEEMESYKKSVIYEYVTGKKEVVL